MTTSKYNMIKKSTFLDGFTFVDIFKYLEGYINFDSYTAKQIAEIMELCYLQHGLGYNKCAHENSIY